MSVLRTLTTLTMWVEACGARGGSLIWLLQGNRFSYMGNGFSKREVEGRDLCKLIPLSMWREADSVLRKGWYLEDADKPFLYKY